MMRMTLMITLMLLVLALAVPAIGSTEQIDGGATIVNSDVLVSEGTPQATVKYVEHITRVTVDSHGNTGGSLNIPD